MERVSTGSCLFSIFLKMSKQVSFIYSLGDFQTAAFALVLGVSKTVYKLFKNRFSISYGSIVLQDMHPTVFQSGILRAPFSGMGPKGGPGSLKRTQSP